MIRTIFYTFWCVLCYFTVFIKAYRFMYVSLLSVISQNITEFLSKILLFPKDCVSSGLSQDPSNKKTIY